MIHLFNRKELAVVYSAQQYHAMTEALAAAGIPYRVKVGGGSVFTADRYHGTPFVNQETSRPYYIYVNKKSFDQAVDIIEGVR